MRAVDLHSRQLTQRHGVTAPQMVVLTALAREEALTAGALAGQVQLSQATLSDILNRLETRGLVTRSRSVADRRRVFVSATAAGLSLVGAAPPLLQEAFLERFAALSEAQQQTIVTALEQVAGMMDPKGLEVSPMLVSGPIVNQAEGCEEV